jgi:hypothetical protein
MWEMACLEAVEFGIEFGMFCVRWDGLSVGRTVLCEPGPGPVPDFHSFSLPRFGEENQ